MNTVEISIEVMSFVQRLRIEMGNDWAKLRQLVRRGYLKFGKLSQDLASSEKTKRGG